MFHLRRKRHRFPGCQGASNTLAFPAWVSGAEGLGYAEGLENVGRRASHSAERVMNSDQTDLRPPKPHLRLSVPVDSQRVLYP